MTQIEILKMAKEAGCTSQIRPDRREILEIFTAEQLRKFVSLVLKFEKKAAIAKNKVSAR